MDTDYKHWNTHGELEYKSASLLLSQGFLEDWSGQRK